jgi:hypothetical protein
VVQLLYELGCLPPDQKVRVKILLTPVIPAVTDRIVPFENFLDLQEESGEEDEISTQDLVKIFESTMLG